MLYLGFPILVAFVCCLFTLWWERRRIRRAHASFLDGREEMADPVFVQRAGAAPEEEAFFLAARRTIAKLSNVTPGMVHPEDSVRSLLDLQFNSGWIEDFVCELEAELNVNLPWNAPPEQQSFGAYVNELYRQQRRDPVQ
jgi:hypothetical protein